MDQSNPYDELLYTGYPFAQSHPDRLATLALLFGMRPSAVESCRVLELGCGDGANLIPIAFGLPESRCVGIDLSTLATAKAKAMSDALDLRNLDIQRMSLLDISSDFGQFDYIIAHGLYSWVEPVVQDKILSICKTHLAPQGVAYVSYNTYPGGYLRRMIREMMLFHVRGIADPVERVGQARGLIKFLAESLPKSDDYAVFLEKELDRTSAREDCAIFHDELSEINSPVYFREFIERAAQHSLQYLTEAHLLDSQINLFHPDAAAALEKEGVGLIAQEQYLDFLKCRRFRQTLLCHDQVSLDRSLKPELVMQMYVASSARPVSARPIIASANANEEFRAANGVVMATPDPLAKAAMTLLGEVWPQSISFDQLLSKARRMLAGVDGGVSPESANQENTELCEFLLKNYRVDVVELHAHQPKFEILASERPVVSPLARLQARQETTITSLRHTSVELKDSLVRQLLLLLDGTRDRTALLRELAEVTAMESDRLQGEGALHVTLDRLEQKLSELGRLALVVA
jgi:methyltransferase-like protein